MAFVYISQKWHKSYIIGLKRNFYNLKVPKIKNFIKWIMPKSMNKFNTLACCCAIFFNFLRQKVFVFIKNHWFYEQIWQEKNYIVYLSCGQEVRRERVPRCTLKIKGSYAGKIANTRLIRIAHLATIWARQRQIRRGWIYKRLI